MDDAGGRLPGGPFSLPGGRDPLDIGARPATLQPSPTDPETCHAPPSQPR